MIDIRLSGEQDSLDDMLGLLRAMEQFQATGEIQDILRDKKIRILDASQPYKNRGDSQIYRQYVKVAIDEQ